MKTRVLPLLVLAGLFAPCALSAAATDVKLTPSADRVRVEVGGKLFTEYVFKGGPKPYLYPVLAADGTELMRHFPMKKGVPGEVEDHPHHRSLWFTHGAVNGVDFWAESDLPKAGQTRQGTIKGTLVSTKIVGGTGEIRSRNQWVGPDGTVHCTDETAIKVRGLADGSRLLDYEVTLKAPADKPVVFGDTKEGSMAIRLPLWMTPDHSYSVNKKRQKHEGKGTIVNAEGIKNDATWGKRSTWVDYYGPKDGKV